MSRSTAAFVFVFLYIPRMSADPQNAIKGQVTDSEGAVIAKAGVRYRFLIPFLEVSSSLHSALEVTCERPENICCYV